MARTKIILNIIQMILKIIVSDPVRSRIQRVIRYKSDAIFKSGLIQSFNRVWLGNQKMRAMGLNFVFVINNQVSYYASYVKFW